MMEKIIKHKAVGNYVRSQYFDEPFLFLLDNFDNLICFHTYCICVKHNNNNMNCDLFLQTKRLI